MGLADVASLAKTIEETVVHGGDIGVEGNLEAYESEMWMRNSRMLGVVDKLHMLYGMRWRPVVGFRGLGLWGRQVARGDEQELIKSQWRL